MTLITKIHQKKFKQFIKACKSKNAHIILVSELSVLWDTVQEIDHNIQIARHYMKAIKIANIDAVIS